MEIVFKKEKGNDIQVIPKLGTGEYYNPDIKGDLWHINNIKTKLLNDNSNQLGAGIINTGGETEDYIFYLGSLVALQNEYFPFYNNYLRNLSLSLANYKILDFDKKANKNYSDLYSKYEKALKDFSYKPKFSQQMSFLNILRKISKTFIYRIDSLEITVSADSELLLLKQNDKGIHYLIVGQKEENIFYGFSGKKPGDFFSKKYKDPDINIQYLVKLFLSQ